MASGQTKSLGLIEQAPHGQLGLAGRGPESKKGRQTEKIEGQKVGGPFPRRAKPRKDRLSSSLNKV